MDFNRALILFAHPDDAEFGLAGTVAGWTREGIDVEYLCVTDGSAGSNEPGVVRAELGADGYTANLVTLVGSYLLAAVLLIVFFRAHRPRGDAAAMLPADSAR